MLKFEKACLYSWVIAAVIVIGLAGCSQQDAEKKFNSADITGVEFGKNWKLTDHTGMSRVLDDFKGKAVVLFFGYTHCPDVCPTTLSDMAQALNSMGKEADRVQVLFVTIDPARDTQALLAKYVPAFNPGFLGLYGDEAATAQIAKEFHAYYQKQQGKNEQSYNVDHTSGSFVFDPSGKLRIFIKYGVKAESIAHDLRALLAEY